MEIRSNAQGHFRFGTHNIVTDVTIEEFNVLYKQYQQCLEYAQGRGFYAYPHLNIVLGGDIVRGVTRIHTIDAVVLNRNGTNTPLKNIRVEINVTV